MNKYNKLTSDQQKEKMLHLMNFRNEVNENKNTQVGTIEYQKVGCNGKVYAIVKENSKFYIKTSEPRDKVLVEHLEYLGGGHRYKNMYEYTSYNNALKNLEEYFINLNQSQGKVLAEERKQNQYQELVTEQTASMRTEINRQLEIMRNSDKVISEGSKSSYSVNHPGDPESNGNADCPSKMGIPFVEKDAVEFETDRDTEITKEKPEEMGTPFVKGEKGTEAEPYESVKSLGTASQGTSVAIQNPQGGKAVKVEESKKLNELSIDDENILNDDIDDEEVVMDIASNNDDMEDEIELDSTLGFVDDANNTESMSDEDIDKEDVELDSELIDKITSLEAKIDSLMDELNVEESFDDIESEKVEPLSDIEENMDFVDGMDDMSDDIAEGIVKGLQEGKKLYLVNEEGMVIHDFGNHPGYRKTPFTTPSNNSKTDNQENGAEDWFGSSVTNDQPFGQKIGDGTPFDEKVKLITDAIVEECITKGIFKKVNKKKD